MKKSKICLVGAGSIADAHAHAIVDSACGELCALVEPSAARRDAFSAKWKIPKTYPSLEAAIAGTDFSVVHVLTPPDTHFALAKQVIEAKLNVFIEKPVAERAEDARVIAEAARDRGVVAAVNQNFVHHPAFAKLRSALRQGKSGPLRHVAVAYNVPLRQMAARQFGHWMFREPKNILLEQAVHPFSQMLALDRDLQLVSSTALPATEISPGVPFHQVAEATFKSSSVTAHLQFAVGRAFPCWQITAVCDDAVLVADILANRFYTLSRSRYLEPVDALLSGLRTSAEIAGASLAGAASYALTLAKLKPRSDPFYVSMRNSITAFYTALAAPGNETAAAEITDATFGGRLVAICEEIAGSAFERAGTRPTATVAEKCDVAVLGGTGFIGAATVSKLVEAGYQVRVMARNVGNLSKVFYGPGVSVVRGDVTNQNDVAKAVAGAKYVVNLAHGGGGANWTEIERALVGSARTVADACREANVQRLLHVGSIAGLYAGDSGDVITGATPPDPRAHERSDYARAKALADGMLMSKFRDEKIPVCILRPGVVLGEGTSPFHGGLGLFNNEQHCMGWNAGANPLPMILVEDVASAIVAALKAPNIDGKCYNLVGDVRPSAREFIAELAVKTRRPLKFHAGSPQILWAEEIGKWLIKRIVGRSAPLPSLRDFKSRGLPATFDCNDAKRDLGWTPVADRKMFFDRVFTGVST